MPSPALPPPAPPPDARDQTPPDAVSHATMLAGRYQLERRIGQGGMSEVWLATDLQLDRRVAVKWLRPSLATDAVVAERFRREAVAVARLNHPNIVAVHDVFEHDGRQAVVMQLVDGRSLRQLLDTQRRMGPELTIHIGAAVASALDEAHRAGFVHRDVKPGNIMLTSDGRVLLTDFGIAKGLDTVSDDLTSDNVMMGTAKYLSPEQVRGKRLDGRADLYSLGLVLYECLAGRVPFQGESDADTALARLQRDPTDLGRLRPTLPPGLVDLIHLTLSRNPEHRPATGADLRSRLMAVDTALPRIDQTPSKPVRRLPERQVSTPPSQPSIPGEPTIVSPRGPDPTRDAETTVAPARRVQPSRRDGRREPRAALASPLNQSRRTSLVVIAALLIAAAVMVAVIWSGLSTQGPSNPDQPPTVLDTGSLNGADTDAGAIAETVDNTEAEPVLTLPDSAGGPLEIIDVSAWDPDGDGSGENDRLASLALVGANPAGGWPTLCYDSQYLGAKRGVGLITTLSGAGSGRIGIESFTAPFWIEIYASPDELAPATLEGWGSSVSGTLYREEPSAVESSLPDGTRHVLIWLREVGQDSACSSTNPYRGRLGNLKFTQ